ncbi:MAG TPA: DUF2520 domain-containing protein [Gemmatimonadaceae bacterium]|nr:DUF2520 domain-containing protein [Gemmatimonadaceae bacterium]
MRYDPIFVMGAGRAGLSLARAFRASGVEVAGVHGRHAPGGPDGVSVGALPPALARASVVLVTVRDQQLDDALRELLAAELAPGTVVLHASGSAEPDMLATVRKAGHPAGTFHPLVPLADPARAVEALAGAYIGIDGDEEARAVARSLAERLGAHVVEIPAGGKAPYHAAAVIASNFPVVLLRIAERVLVDAGIPADSAAGAARSLLRQAVRNIESSDAARALTGPIVRGDAVTVRKHLLALASDPEALAVYRAISVAALELALESGTPSEQVAAVRAALG